jgi:hypothetical protein
MGIWSLDADRRERRASILTEWYGHLARGEASWRDLPIHPFQPPLDRDLHGFLPLIEAGPGAQ